MKTNYTEIYLCMSAYAYLAHSRILICILNSGIPICITEILLWFRKTLINKYASTKIKCYHKSKNEILFCEVNTKRVEMFVCKDSFVSLVTDMIVDSGKTKYKYVTKLCRCTTI